MNDFKASKSVHSICSSNLRHDATQDTKKNSNSFVHQIDKNAFEFRRMNTSSSVNFFTKCHSIRKVSKVLCKQATLTSEPFRNILHLGEVTFTRTRKPKPLTTKFNADTLRANYTNENLFLPSVTTNNEVG